jgi:hypothetical protein
LSTEVSVTNDRPRLLFDSQDYELVELVNEFLSTGRRKNPERLRKLFDHTLHPRGIKELAASPQRRIAYAVIRLLDSLAAGDAQNRILSLQALKDEVLHASRASMPKNTARVLIEIMKQLVRERGRMWHQVELAHDFFAAVSGRPVVIREQLRRCHLLEMSEDWNQVAFDSHVHDANTKGRKAPTHLIMDAWIKGIRELTVIYYSYMTREAVAELTEAAKIMEIKVRACVEVSAPFRGKLVQFIWEPHGFESDRDFLDFLEEPGPQAFFDEGRKVAALHGGYVLALLKCFNERHLQNLNERYGLTMAPLSEEGFLEFVDVGQPSVAHLADYIHHTALDHVQAQMGELRARCREGTAAERRELQERIDRLNGLAPELIAEEHLSWAKNPGLPDPKKPPVGVDVPRLLRLPPKELLECLNTLRPGARITLNPSNLSHLDVLEILYDTQGIITHLEIFNLKDYRRHKNPHIAQIAKLRRTLNDASTIAFKHLVQEMIREIENGDALDRQDRLEKFRAILRGFPALLSHYAHSPLRSRIGSDSIGRSRTLFGMGLAVRSTLPSRARREFDRRPGTQETIPVKTQALMTTTWIPRHSHLVPLDLLYRGLRHAPLVGELGYTRQDSYIVPPNVTRMGEPGDIITLGGIEEHPSNGLSLSERGARPSGSPPPSWHNLNTTLKSALKVFIGFIPAFLTFYLTKDWWVLAWFGALIWFAITGVRNVGQAIIGGGLLHRSHLLRWNDLVSWERISDSLLFTGFSVPLLDWLVKGVLLDHGLGVTTATAPLALYSVMALANGAYLFSHNTFRGLPRAAAIGNLFRSILSIPIAFAINAALLEAMTASGMATEEANALLQNWAAVIGKFASDMVAGVIEGTADRNANLRIRDADYKAKLAMLLDAHGQLEILFPEQDVLEMLKSPKEFIRAHGEEVRDVLRQQVVNALDLMYFWMYQPQARVMFERHLQGVTAEEREIILQTQRLLERQRPISEMFLDSLVGKNFSPPLAFYLDKSPSYLKDIQKLAAAIGVEPSQKALLRREAAGWSAEAGESAPPPPIAPGSPTGPKGRAPV